jgi:hypothetical protein
MSSLKDLVEVAQNFKKKMEAEGKGALNASFKDFFEKHPEATSIVWVQYTPYFNDGDACTFGVRDMELRVDSSKMEEDVRVKLENDGHDFDGGYGYGDACASKIISAFEDNESNQRYKRRGVTTLRDLTANEQLLLTDFDELISACHQIPDVLEMVFGDHMEITATADGFQVEEWSHD